MKPAAHEYSCTEVFVSSNFSLRLIVFHVAYVWEWKVSLAWSLNWLVHQDTRTVISRFFCTLSLGTVRVAPVTLSSANRNLARLPGSCPHSTADGFWPSIEFRIRTMQFVRRFVRLIVWLMLWPAHCMGSTVSSAWTRPATPHSVITSNTAATAQSSASRNRSYISTSKRMRLLLLTVTEEGRLMSISPFQTLLLAPNLFRCRPSMAQFNAVALTFSFKKLKKICRGRRAVMKQPKQHNLLTIDGCNNARQAASPA